MGKPSNRPVKILIFIAVLWRSALSFSGFKTMTPDYGLEPSEKTRVYVAYDSNNLYFAIRCLEPLIPKPLYNIARSILSSSFFGMER